MAAASTGIHCYYRGPRFLIKWRNKNYVNIGKQETITSFADTIVDWENTISKKQ